MKIKAVVGAFSMAAVRSQAEMQNRKLGERTCNTYAEKKGQRSFAADNMYYFCSKIPGSFLLPLTGDTLSKECQKVCDSEPRCFAYEVAQPAILPVYEYFDGLPNEIPNCNIHMSDYPSGDLYVDSSAVSDGNINNCQREAACWTHYSKIKEDCGDADASVSTYQDELQDNDIEGGNDAWFGSGDEAWLYNCSHEGCTNIAAKRGVCVRHGAAQATHKKCSHEGAKVKQYNKKCSREGCDSVAAFDGGFCVNHRVKVTYTRCSYEGCKFYAKNAAFCGAHMDDMANREPPANNSGKGENIGNPNTKSRRAVAVPKLPPASAKGIGVGGNTGFNDAVPGGTKSAVMMDAELGKIKAGKEDRVQGTTKSVASALLSLGSSAAHGTPDLAGRSVADARGDKEEGRGVFV